MIDARGRFREGCDDGGENDSVTNGVVNRSRRLGECGIVRREDDSDKGGMAG